MKNDIVVHKIGEYALGGIVETEIDQNARITIRCKDWNTKKIVLEKTFDFVDKSKLMFWLEDEVTSYYYTEKIMKSLYD